MTLRKDRFRLSYPHKAFTLVELLVVVAVLALLASIVFSNLTGAREQAKISNALSFQSNMHNLLGADLVGWWNFDDEDNRYKDLSGYGNNGSCTSCPTLVDGVPGTSGKALEFDGIDSTTANRLNTNLIYEKFNEFTISVWVYRYLPKSFQFIVGGYVGNNISMGIITQDLQRFSLHTYDGRDQNLATSSKDSLPVNEWIHLLATVKFFDIDKGEVILYANSIDVGSGSFLDLTTYNRVTMIGSPGNNTFNRAFNGLIDDVRIYSRALTAYEVQTLYAQTKDNYLAEEQ